MSRVSKALPLLILPILAHPASALTFYSPTPEEDSCTLHGDADIYGPGVRASFYLSFVAGVLAMEWNLLEELEKV
ncbi:hypothetical protein PRZ48_005391 [Zasmidium cellare]|uniref:Uncharacterized protein n=1 Tax=Zasmidium cellare TaxID=395010 RepID=A0ABR0ET95_ZASCE|nr:hypothetical protein PRZ48_005391 [Zasmidium cellare]